MLNCVMNMQLETTESMRNSTGETDWDFQK